jgi:hypothetical protein
VVTSKETSSGSIPTSTRCRRPYSTSVAGSWQPSTSRSRAKDIALSSGGHSVLDPWRAGVSRAPAGSVVTPRRSCVSAATTCATAVRRARLSTTSGVARASRMRLTPSASPGRRLPIATFRSPSSVPAQTPGRKRPMSYFPCGTRPGARQQETPAAAQRI